MASKLDLANAKLKNNQMDKMITSKIEKKGFLWLIFRSIEVLANHSPMIFKQYLGYNKI